MKAGGLPYVIPMLLLSVAFAISSAWALAGFDSKPLPSPPPFAALAAGLRNPVFVGADAVAVAVGPTVGVAVDVDVLGGVGGGPLVLIKTFKAGFAPPTSRATSGLPSLSKSLAEMKIPPMLD